MWEDAFCVCGKLKEGPYKVREDPSKYVRKLSAKLTERCNFIL